MFAIGEGAVLSIMLFCHQLQAAIRDVWPKVVYCERLEIRETVSSGPPKCRVLRKSQSQRQQTSAHSRFCRCIVWLVMAFGA